MGWIDKSQLGLQFRYWSWHVVLTALPSFLVALKQFSMLPAILAMVAGILTFLFGYTLLCSTVLYQKVSHETLLGRAVRVGAKIRLILSLATAPLLLFAWFEIPAFLLAPDFWAGWGAILFVSAVGNALFGYGGGFMELAESFVFVYLVTVVEGLIISFTLILFAFFSLLSQTRKANRTIQQTPIDPSV